MSTRPLSGRRSRGSRSVACSTRCGGRVDAEVLHQRDQRGHREPVALGARVEAVERQDQPARSELTASRRRYLCSLPVSVRGRLSRGTRSPAGTCTAQRGLHEVLQLAHRRSAAGAWVARSTAYGLDDPGRAGRYRATPIHRAFGDAGVGSSLPRPRARRVVAGARRSCRRCATRSRSSGRRCARCPQVWFQPPSRSSAALVVQVAQRSAPLPPGVPARPAGRLAARVDPARDETGHGESGRAGPERRRAGR